MTTATWTTFLPFVVAEEEEKESVGMILGVDVSGWNPSINWDLLYHGGVRFAVIKLTQGISSLTNLAREHVEGARKAGMLVAGYHWNDPMLDDNKQIDFFTSQLEKYNIHLGYVDVEQYWESWTEFYAMLRGTGTITKFISPTRISQSSYNMMTGLRNRGFNGQIYSRWSFILDRASPMQLWIPPQESWYAHWPYKTGRVNISWNDIKPGGYWYPSIPQPWLPVNVKWKMWQFSGDKFILPGTGGIPIDFNLFNGDEIQLKNHFTGSEIIPVPPVTPPPTNGVILPVLKVINKVNVRLTPSTAIKEIRERQPGEVVVVQEIKPINAVSVWVRDNEGWSAVVHYGVRYME